MRRAQGLALMLICCGTPGLSAAPSSTRPPAVLRIDWTSGLGSSDFAIGDQSKANPLSGLIGSAGILSVTAAPGSPPGGFTNALQVLHTAGTAPSAHVASGAIWPSPQVGETRYFRDCLYYDWDDAEGDRPWTGNHPYSNHWTTEPGADDGDIWETEMANNPDGTFKWVSSFAIQGGAITRHIYPGAGLGSASFNFFTKRGWWTREWALTKTAPNTFTIPDIRYTNPAGVLVRNKNSLYCADGATLLSAANTGVVMPNETEINLLWIGTNAGGGNQGLTNPQRTYWGGLCVRSDDWCGPYSLIDG